MKRTVAAVNTPYPKRARGFSRIKLDFDPKLNEMLAETENELETECLNITNRLRQETLGKTLELRKTNLTGITEDTKRRSVQMCKELFTNKMDVDTRTTQHNSIVAMSRVHSNERYKRLIETMCTLNTVNDIEDNLVHQMNVISEECRASANVIEQARADGVAKLEIWKHTYIQFRDIRSCTDSS
jgi:hypothetical protein